MSVKIKTLSRHNWQRVLEREFRWRNMRTEDFDGEIGLLTMKRTTAPLIVHMGDHTLKLVDDGYRWLQYAPRDKRWWLTVSIDDKGDIVQYYFDVTRLNVLMGNGKSYFYDMFLDVVALPNGEVFLLDEDELQMALDSGNITSQEANDAYETANELMSSIDELLGKFSLLTRKYLRILSAPLR